MSDHDVVVLGGGPAGAAAAILLARRAHRVALVRPANTPGGSLAVSVPPSARRLFDELGILGAVERARFHPNLGNTVWWAGADRRGEGFAGEAAGFHVDRVSLERVLVAAAESLGVAVLLGMSARRAERGGDGWTIQCTDGGGGELRLRAPWVVDATGRHGLLARETREPDRSTTTLALVRRFRRAGGWSEDLRGHTLIESYADGWAWSVPLADDLRCVTAMIDQRQSDLTGRDMGTMLDGELAKARHLGEIAAAGEPADEAWACPAALYTSRRFGRSGLLLAGDAGSFIDPLSSYGVKKALASGWLAGVVAHTALIDPGMTDVALDFFDARERDVYRSYRARSATFFREAAHAHGTAYWTTRADAAAAAGEASHTPDPPAGVRTEALGADDDGAAPGDARIPAEAVRAAFEALKARPALAAAAGATLRTLERAAIEGHRIVLATHYATDRVPAGIRFANNVDLGTVVRLAPEHAQVPDLWEAYNAEKPPVPLPDFLTGLSTAFAAGLLEHRDG